MNVWLRREDSHSSPFQNFGWLEQDFFAWRVRVALAPDASRGPPHVRQVVRGPGSAEHRCHAQADPAYED